MLAQPSPRFTPEQYLEIERQSDVKHEYFDGQMFAMSGGSYAHARVKSNFEFELNLRLKGSGCHAVSSDLRVRIGPGGLHTYPDIIGACGEPQMADDQKDTLLNPVFIIEVLSRSTEAHDRGLKFREYRKIESLKEYVLVSQSAPLIEVFARGPEGDWRLREYSGFDATCQLASVGCETALGDIYNGVPL